MLNNCDYSQFLKRIISHWLNHVKNFSKNQVEDVTIVTLYFETIVAPFIETHKYLVVTIVKHIFESLKMDRIFPQ